MTATIAFRNYASATFSSASSGTVNKPSGVATGDVLLVWIIAQVGTAPAPVITPHTAGQWTELKTLTGSKIRCSLYRRVVADGSTEPSSYQFDFDKTSSGTLAASAYTAVDNTTPEDVTPSGVSSSGTTATATAITTVTADTKLVGFVACNASSTLTQPGGWAEEYETGSSPIESADLDQGTAGGSGTPAWTLGTSRTYFVFLAALRPASGGTTQTGAEAVAAQATLAPNAHLTAAAQEPLAAAATLGPNAHVTAQAQEPIPAAASLSPLGRRILAGRLAISAVATLTPAALLTAAAQEPLAAQATLSPLGYRVRSGSMAVPAAAVTSPNGRLVAQALGAVAALATLSLPGRKIAAGRAAISAAASLSPSSRLTAAAQAALSALASLAPPAYRVRSGRELIAAQATVTPNTLGITAGKAAIAVQAALTPKSSNPLQSLVHTPGLFLSNVQVDATHKQIDELHSEIRDTGGWATTATISWNSAQSSGGVMNYGYVDNVLNTFLAVGITNFRIEIDTNHNTYCWRYQGAPSIIPSRPPRDCAGNVAGGWYYFVYHLVDYLLQHSGQYTILGVGQLNEAMAAFPYYIAGYLDDLVTPAYPSRWAGYLDAQHYLYNAAAAAAAAHGTQVPVLNDGIASQGMALLRACVKWRAAAGDPVQEQAIVDELNAYAAYSGVGSYRFPFTVSGTNGFQTQIVDTVNPATGHSDYTEFLAWWDTCYCLPEESAWYETLQYHFYARPEYLQPLLDWFHAQLAAIGADRRFVAGEIGTVWNETISHASHDDARYGRWLMATLLSAAGEGTEWSVFWMLLKQKEHQNQEMMGVYDGYWDSANKVLLPPYVATPYSQPALRLVLSVLHGVVRVQKRHPGDGSYFLYRFERADGSWFLGGYVKEDGAPVSGIDLGTGLATIWQRDYTNAYTSVNPASVTLTNVPVVFQPELVLWPAAAAGGGLSAGPLAVVQQAQAVVSTVATLAPAARLTAQAREAVVAQATLTPSSRRLRQALTTPIPALAALSPNAHLTAQAREAVVAQATLTPAGGQLGFVTAQAVLSVAAGLAGQPVLVAGGQVLLAATVQVTAWAGLVTAQAAIVAQATLTPAGRAVAAALLAVAGRATLTPAARLRTRAAASMVAQATLSPRGVERAGGAVAMAAAASMSPDSYVQWTTAGAVQLAAQAALVPAGLATLAARVQLAAQAQLAASASTPGPVLGAARMAAAATLAASPSTHEPMLGTALVSPAATLAVSGRETAAAQTHMDARAGLTAGVQATEVGVALLLATATLAARGTALPHLHTSGSILGPGRRSSVSGPARRGSVSGWQ